MQGALGGNGDEAVSPRHLVATDYLAAGGVLAILLAVIVYNHLQVARGLRAKTDKPRTPKDLVGRHASHRGDVVGEVVGATTDRLVLRRGAGYAAVPLAHVRMREGDVSLEGEIDWVEAEDAGRAWMARDARGLEANGAAQP